MDLEAIFSGISGQSDSQFRENVGGEVVRKTDLSVMPSAVFTIPEAASVGSTEEECKSAGTEYRVFKSFFRANGKAVCMGETDGLCKLLAGSDGKIIGCHVLGPHAADLVQEVSSLMSVGATVDGLRHSVHIHPTLSEVLLSALE